MLFVLTAWDIYCESLHVIDVFIEKLKRCCFDWHSTRICINVTHREKKKKKTICQISTIICVWVKWICLHISIYLHAKLIEQIEQSEMIYAKINSRCMAYFQFFWFIVQFNSDFAVGSTFVPKKFIQTFISFQIKLLRCYFTYLYGCWRVFHFHNHAGETAV